MTDFPGTIGATIADSTPWWPDVQTGRRNLLVVILDDTGWSDFGCFGSEIATPHIDALAERGARFTNFHVQPLCSPTRASFLSGRNNHAIGMRFLADTDTGFPNSRGAIRPGTPLLPEVLRDAGYGTYLVGKWHLAPLHEITPAGPHRNWPLARGFERYYGFLDGCVDQYEPELYEDNHPVPVPEREGYHLSEDLVDRAIGYLRDHRAFRPEDPFFLQLAFGATHAPFQAPREFIERYVETFTKGWDVTRRERLQRQIDLRLMPADAALTERNDGVRAWDDLDDVEREVFAHLQAAFAGFLEHTDAQLGRLLQALDELGCGDTIVAVFADNGASREGGPTGDIDTNAPYSGVYRPAEVMADRLDRIGSLEYGVHYPEGWAMAGNTPFRRYKQFVDLGGARSPLIVTVPGAEPGIHDPFVHVIDLAPTFYELLGVDAPSGMDGESLAARFTGEAVPGRATQYWETLGHRAIWHDGWRAVTAHVPGTAYSDDVWRLYDTRVDAAEVHDVADEHPEVLADLQRRWQEEAERNEVFPLDDRPLRELLETRGPHGMAAQSDIVLLPGMSHVPAAAAVAGSHRSMTVTGVLTNDASAASGTLVSSGNVQGGWFLAVDHGALVVAHKLLDDTVEVRVPGAVTGSIRRVGLRLTVADDRSARLEALVEGKTVGAAAVPLTSSHLSFLGLDLGASRMSGFEALQEKSLPAGLLRSVVLSPDIPAGHSAHTLLATE